MGKIERFRDQIEQEKNSPVGNNWYLYLDALTRRDEGRYEAEMFVAEDKARQHGIEGLERTFAQLREQEPELIEEIVKAQDRRDFQALNRLLVGPVHDLLNSVGIDSTIFAG